MSHFQPAPLLDLCQAHMLSGVAKKRENDAAVLALSEIAPQQVGNRPGVGGDVVGCLGHVLFFVF